MDLTSAIKKLMKWVIKREREGGKVKLYQVVSVYTDEMGYK